VFIVPALIFAFVGLHLWLVIKHGISETPRSGDVVDKKTYRPAYEDRMKKDGVPFFPDAAWRDMVFCTAMLVGIVLLAVFVGPPLLDNPPDPSLTQADPRPDWYLLWYFAVLAFIPNAIEKYFIIIGPMFAGAILLFFPLFASQGERSPSRRPWAIGIIVLVVLMVGVFWYLGIKSPWSPNFEARPLPAEVVRAESGPVADGAKLFFSKGCLNCHLIEQYGGRRGPNLTTIGDLLTRDQMIIRIANGGVNMPAYAQNMTPGELNDVIAFLQSRSAKNQRAPAETAPLSNGALRN
jgi:ubiquinol-cytochrome c reductase cytochrome b subunit